MMQHRPATDDVKPSVVRRFEKLQRLGREHRILRDAVKFGPALRYLDRFRGNIDAHHMCAEKSELNGVAAIAASQLQNVLPADIAECMEGEFRSQPGLPTEGVTFDGRRGDRKLIVLLVVEELPFRFPPLFRAHTQFLVSFRRTARSDAWFPGLYPAKRPRDAFGATIPKGWHNADVNY